MNTPEELKNLREEVESMKEKLAELTEDELKQIAGSEETVCLKHGLASPQWTRCISPQCPYVYMYGIDADNMHYRCRFFNKEIFWSN